MHCYILFGALLLASVECFQIQFPTVQPQLRPSERHKGVSACQPSKWLLTAAAASGSSSGLQQLAETGTSPQLSASVTGGAQENHERALRRNEGLLRAAENGAVELNFFTVEPAGGEETAEPVLILHGLLGSSRNFASWAKSLSQRLTRPRRIIVPDLRNHGESGHTRSMSYVSMAMDVIKLLESQGIERCCVIGHSMGGKVAATMALVYPESIESVAILDIAPADYSKTIGKQSETWTDIRRIIGCLHELPLSDVKERKDADRLLARNIEDPLLRGFALTNLVPDVEGGWYQTPLPSTRLTGKWRINIDAIQRNMGLIGGFDLGQGVQEPASLLGISFPRDAFFVQGGNSRFIRSIHIGEISTLFPKFTLQTIRGAGHWVHSEDPEATLQNVQQFLDRADPTPFPDNEDYY